MHQALSQKGVNLTAYVWLDQPIFLEISVPMHSNKQHLSDLCLQNFNFIRSTKISDLMHIPPVALISHDNLFSELCYPKPLVQLWKDCTEVKSTKASSGHFIICNIMSLLTKETILF